MEKVAVFILILFSFEVFSQTSVGTLENKIDFDNISGLPLTEKYGQVSSVKVVYDIKSGRLFFINSKFFKFHHEFCSNRLENGVDIEYFNSINYSNTPQRKYLLANVNYFKSLGTYALEISPVDLMLAKDIIFLRDLVSRSTFIGDSLHFLLNSTRLQELSTELEGVLPILNPSDIYRNLDYQAVAKYRNCGVLNYINRGNLENNETNPMDIIVIDETPLFLPKVAGVIVSEFQTPLSHLTILGQNRKIPIAAYKKAFSDSALIRMNHKKVCLEVFSNAYKIEPIKKLNPSAQTKRGIKLKYDLAVDSLVGIEHITRKSFKFAGNKAANFGTLYHLSKKCDFKVPESAFVIPFYFYNQHVLKSNAKPLIDSIIKNPGNINKDTLLALLEDIKRAIYNTPVDTKLLELVNAKVLANPEITRFRFRSSTNAEDAKGFSGAGIYTSKTGVYNHEKKTFEKAIKSVWASLWSYEAFSEREYFNINHQDVFMGILVHRSFPDEKVNGVAITKNLYRPDIHGFVVNTQLGEESVVDPRKGVISDQFICYPEVAKVYNNSIDIITQSNLNEDNLVMTKEEIKHLANQLEFIKKHYFNNTSTSKSYIDYGLDIEFKLDTDDRLLYIKQVRPYND